MLRIDRIFITLRNIFQSDDTSVWCQMDKSREEWFEYFVFRSGKGERKAYESRWRSSSTRSYPLPLPKIAIRKVDCAYAFPILFELKFGSTFLPSCVRRVWQIGLWLLRYEKWTKDLFKSEFREDWSRNERN